MRYTSTDNLRSNYIEELNFQFQLRAELREMEETGETVGSEKKKVLIANSMKRAQEMDEEIQGRFFKA